MKIGAIVQARMSSHRLPGKVMREVAGKPMLQYLMERLSRCASLDRIVVATSADESDDVIAEFCKGSDLPCHRGSLGDVAGRFKGVLDEWGFDAFVRVSGDSPLMDQRLIDRAAAIFLSGDYDIVTNVLERTYPSGQSVELLRSDVFRAGYESMVEEEDLEHVTLFFYKNRGGYRIFNFTSEENYNGARLSVDTPEDMELFAETVEKMDRPQWEYGLDEVLTLRNAIR